MSPPSSLGPVLSADDEFDATDGSREDERSRMSFLEHLEELRKRIIYSLYAVCAGCAVSFWFIDALYYRLIAYFTGLIADQGGKVIMTSMTEGFMFQMTVAIGAGALLASPFVFAQLWFFVAPGLYAREKKVVLPFVFFSTGLFATGVWFAHWLAFPSMFKFFASYGNSYVTFFPSLGEVFSFYIKMLLGFGLVFQMPILVFFLARFGIVTWRFMAKQFKYAILIIFILAAVVTPSGDPINQTIFAAPMIVLYIVSIGVAWMFGKKRTPKTA